MSTRDDYQLPPKEGFVLTHFLTVADVKRKDHAAEIRCYMRDPDGYIIEVGQTTTPRA